MKRAPILLLVLFAACSSGESVRLGQTRRSTTTVVTAPLPRRATGVNGTVTAGPTCPVERPDQPCPPRPLSVKVEARRAGGEVAGATQSDADGRYALALPPGQYQLVAVTGTTYPHCAAVDVTVPPAQITHADIHCDTGIR